MALGADRYATRGDTLVFLSSLALSLVAMSLPPAIRDPIARLRQEDYRRWPNPRCRGACRRWYGIEYLDRDGIRNASDAR